MPVQLIFEQVPVLLSLIAFYLDAGENIFLTYSHGRENGPEIKRNGRGSPFMEYLYPIFPGEVTSHPDGLRLRSWLIREDLRQQDLDYARSKLVDAQKNAFSAKAVPVLEKYLSENPRLAAHDTEFTREYSNHEIVGQQGCGDLTMNFWNVAYINSRLALRNQPSLIFLHGEPLASRTYSCLVKWLPTQNSRSKLTIEDLRFFSNAADPNQMVWTYQGNRWIESGQHIEFAVSNQQILRNGRICDLGRLTHQFSDLRHLIQMPNLNPPKSLFVGDRERPRYYFGRLTDDDIWFGEAQLIDDINLQRAAMNGPIFLSRIYEGLGASVDQLRGAFALAEYLEKADVRDDLNQGEYRFVPEDDSRVEVYFRRSAYGWSLIGLPPTGDRILCLACHGDPAARQGHGLEAVTDRLRIAGASDALLIDEGADVFQVALLGSGGSKAKMAGTSSELNVMVPLKRSRMRATFVFARDRRAG